MFKLPQIIHIWCFGVSLYGALPWGNEDTQLLIDILAKYDIKATFFIVGNWARKYPESVKALHNAGHDIMSHSNHHDHMTKLSTEQIVSDLQATNKDIAAITGVTPVLFRAPYGEYDDKVILAVRSIGMETIQWDVEALATKVKYISGLKQQFQATYYD